MKTALVILFCALLTGCATNGDQFETYVNAQKSLNKDGTMTDMARIAALVEIVRTTEDSAVKIEAIRALQQIQRSKQVIIIEPKKSLFGF